MASEPIWGVIVVHGVGHTGPGVTLEAILPTLRDTNRSGLTEIAQPETRLLPEPTPGLPPKRPVPPQTPQHTSTVPLGQRFPVHVRRFRIEKSGAGDPTQAAVAEVFWADLSTAGEGTLRLLLRLFTVIFDLRFIPYVAAACPHLYVARWLRFALFWVSWLLCGPIAGLTAFIVYVLAARYAVSKLPAWLRVPGELDDREVLALALIGVVLGLVLLAVRRWKNWREHWSFVIGWIIAAASTDVVLAFARTATGPPWPWETWLGTLIAERLSLQPAALGTQPVSTHLAVLLGLLYAVFLVVGVLTALAFVSWMLAHLEARTKKLTQSAPALNAALATALLQIGLWVIVVPALGAVMLRQWSPGMLSGNDSVFGTVMTSFAQNLGLAGLIILTAATIWFWRAGWVHGHPPPYTVATGRGIPRLLVHDAIVSIIFVVSFVGSLATVYALTTGMPRLGGVLSGSRGWAVGGALALIAIVSALFQKGLRNALHILMDVVSHFSRDGMPVPWPSTPPEETLDPNVFTIQQKLEARFRSVLDEVLQLGDVKRLTVVAHSQGTMIAIDVLWLEWAFNRLKGIDVDLVTMGCPFTHLYQYYFPHRYPPLFDGNTLDTTKWEGSRLDSTVQRWLNIYRIDDFVGTHVDGNESGTFPVNTCIRAGGHTGYWHQCEALVAMRSYLPGR